MIYWFSGEGCLISIYLPKIYLLVISSFGIMSEKILIMNSLFLKICWDSFCDLSWRMFCVLSRRMCIWQLLSEMFCICLLGSIEIGCNSKSSYLAGFCLNNLSIYERGVKVPYHYYIAVCPANLPFDQWTLFPSK